MRLIGGHLPVQGGVMGLAVAAAVVFAACSSSGESPSSSQGAAASGQMQVTDAWARPTMGKDVPSAAYLTVTNGTGQDDALVSASSPAAKVVELHEVVPAGSAMPEGSGDGMGMASEAPTGSMGMDGMDGMMVMRPVESIELPSGASVELKPGGYHIMLIEPTSELKPGDKVELTLTFAKAPQQVVTAVVKEP